MKNPRQRKSGGAHLKPSARMASGRNVSEIETSSRLNAGLFYDKVSLNVILLDDQAPDGLDSIGMSEFLNRPNIALACADYLYHWGPAKDPGTRRNFVKYVRRLWNFLDSWQHSFGEDIQDLEMMKTDVFSQFLKWLLGELKIGAPGEKGAGDISANTAVPCYNKICRMFDWFQITARYKGKLHPGLTFTRNAVPGRHRRTTHKAVVPEATLSLIRAACFAEIPETLAKLGHGYAVLRDANIDIPDLAGSSPTPFKSFEVCLKSYSQVERAGLTGEELARTSPGLKRALRHPYHTLLNVQQHLHFTPRTLVPFILLLDIDTLFNVKTILTGGWSDISESQLFGEDREVFKGKKYKGIERIQIRSFSKRDKHLFSVSKMLAYLKKYSRNTAEFINVRLRDRIFIFVNKNHGVYGSFAKNENCSAWNVALESFIKDHGLPAFTMAQFRPTGSALVSKMTNGDVKAQQAALNHKRVTTTLESYMPPEATARLNENLAREMLYRDRYRDSNGRADIRGSGLLGPDRSTVTQGFFCLEPLFSPIQGQKEGRLCSAFGQCPACPNAMVDKTDPKALYRLLQLQERIEEARTECDPARWIKYWHPQALALERRWLPLFLPDIAYAASKLSMNAIPRLD